MSTTDKPIARTIHNWTAYRSGAFITVSGLDFWGNRVQIAGFTEIEPIQSEGKVIARHRDHWTAELSFLTIRPKPRVEAQAA